MYIFQHKSMQIFSAQALLHFPTHAIKIDETLALLLAAPAPHQTYIISRFGTDKAHFAVRISIIDVRFRIICLYTIIRIVFSLTVYFTPSV